MESRSAFQKGLSRYIRKTPNLCSFRQETAEPLDPCRQRIARKTGSSNASNKSQQPLRSTDVDGAHQCGPTLLEAVGTTLVENPVSQPVRAQWRLNNNSYLLWNESTFHQTTLNSAEPPRECCEARHYCRSFCFRVVCAQEL